VVVVVNVLILIESIEDSFGPGLSLRITSSELGVPVKPIALKRAEVPVSSTASGSRRSPPRPPSWVVPSASMQIVRA